MMKRCLFFLLLAVMVGSCKPPKNEGSLSLSIPRDSVDMQSSLEGIPSCSDLASGATSGITVKKPYFTTPISYTWSGSKLLTIDKIVVTLYSNYLIDSKFVTTIQGPELNAVMCGSTAACANLGPLTGNGALYKSVCNLRVGGVNLSDINAPAFMSGTIRVSGIEVDANDNINPVSAEASISLGYEGVTP